MSKLIVVTGATGAQGGSIIETLLKDPSKWKVRAVTRNTTSDAAKKLASRGVEVVKADLGKKDEIKSAFKGAYGVYAVTNFWDPEIFPKNIGLEKQQGISLVDAAVEEGVHIFVWSALHDVAKISGGKLHVPHFTGKNEVEQYARQQSQKNPNFISAFFYPGFYTSNFIGFFKASLAKDGVAEFGGGIASHVKIPFYNASRDTGALVVPIFSDPTKFSGKIVLGAAEYLTLPEVVSIYQRVTGQPARFSWVDPDFLKANGAPEEFVDTLRWFNTYGYYNNEDISATKQVASDLQGFEGWLVESKWRV